MTEDKGAVLFVLQDANKTELLSAQKDRPQWQIDFGIDFHGIPSVIVTYVGLIGQKETIISNVRDISIMGRILPRHPS